MKQNKTKPKLYGRKNWKSTTKKMVNSEHTRGKSVGVDVWSTIQYNNDIFIATQIINYEIWPLDSKVFESHKSFKKEM